MAKTTLEFTKGTSLGGYEAYVVEFTSSGDDAVQIEREIGNGEDGTVSVAMYIDGQTARYVPTNFGRNAGGNVIFRVRAVSGVIVRLESRVAVGTASVLSVNS